MTAPPPVLWVIRPDDRIEATAKAFSGLGVDLKYAPVLSYVPTGLALPLSQHYDGLVVTSLRALEHIQPIPDHLKACPLFIVGSESARRARILGFARVIEAPTITALIAEIEREVKTESHLLYLRGDVVSQDLGGVFAARHPDCRIVIDEHLAYRTAPAPSLDKDITEAIGSGEISHIAFFSAAGAAHFAALIEQSGLSERMGSITALCLSPRVLEYARSLPWAQTYTAETPDMTGMVALYRTLLRP